MPCLIVVMGVAGSGKSTLAHALAEHYALPYLDADDFHSDSAKAHMASGKPLTDAMRQPWIERICRYLRERSERDESLVLAFSGLKRHHRDPLRECGFDRCFLFLQGDAPTVAQRLSEREGHFMPPSLLESQFQALEPPRPDEEPDVHLIDLRPNCQSIQDFAIQCVEQLKRRQTPP